MDYKGLKAYVIALLKEGLPNELSYHGLRHTLDVLASVENYLKEEKIEDPRQQELLKVGALLHDSGFTKSYENHEENGVLLSNEILPKYGYCQKDIELVSGLIMATKVPQSPQNHLEQILCDCDLDYLGRSDFEEISQTLFKEWKALGLIQSLAEFNEKQIKFLESHSFFTKFAKSQREPNKNKQLLKLKSNH